jgi:hypothetical protein
MHGTTLEEVFALPDEAEQEYLLLGLAKLIKQRGADTFLGAPLLLPEPEFWPDPVEPRGHGVAVLLRRLLSYAGMGELGVEIEIGARRASELVDEPARDPSEEPPLHHAAGWFMGIEDDVCRFGVSDSSLRDEESLIGTLGHEVAHAYRERHHLVVVTRSTEEQLTDLTTVYLGFGFFTLQSSYRFRTGHYGDSGQPLLYERQTLGYLRPGQLALLLAAQLVVRAQGKQELARALDALAPNHAAALERAHRELARDRARLIELLGLPPEDEWPEPASLASLVGPLQPATVRVSDHVALERQWARERKVAFRVRGDRAKQGAAVGTFLGFMSCLIDGVGLYMWLLMPALAAFGHWFGRGIGSPRCSSCDHSVGREQERCTFCDTRLVGNIEDVNDRIQAEEDYFESRAHSKQGPEGERDSHA